MSVRIGVVGCGRQAPKHIGGLRASGDVEIVVADLDPARAAALASAEGVAVADVEEVFADRGVAAVSICTPPASHAALVRRAISAGKHFICEKPLTADLAEARALEAEATRAKIVGMVGYLYRFAPAFELARKAVEAGALGKLSSAFFRLGGPGSHGAWQHRSETGGGAINEMLVHMADLATWLLGPIVEARLLAAEIRQPRREISGETVEADVEDWVLARLRSEAGADIVIEADLVTPTFIQFAELHGGNGSFMGSIQADMPTFVHCLEARGGFAAGKIPHAFGPRNLFVPQMGLFLDCVAGLRTLDRCTLADSVRTMEIVERLRSAQITGL